MPSPLQKETINDVANDNSCGAMHDEAIVEFKLMCLYLFAWNGITFCKSTKVAQQLILFKWFTLKI